MVNDCLDHAALCGLTQSCCWRFLRRDTDATVVNSLIETNLGVLFMMLIRKAWRVRHPKEFLALPVAASPSADQRELD
ncbi:hypothetical protein FYJ43_05135 [Cutibacterium sp. WCA-380-WT-3A]|uniref:Uncharacterized protein n=1 Tax=Cutibacterium porci TaxID=2605781 RepID=A0A7K0J681_9ACTN|nr:hypothetical protein [Cutibacterium porci]